jgi:predicted nucleotidyltransferase
MKNIMNEKFTNTNNPKVRPDHRFDISPESMELLKDARTQFIKLKEKFPELSGITFFGSRTQGTEKPSSDIDCVLFSELNVSPEEKYDHFFELKEIAQKELNLYKKNKNSLASYSIMSIIDISKEETDKDIAEFRHLVNEQKRGRLGFTKGKTTQPHPSTGSLITRFFLGTGEGLYKNREYILEKLAQEKDGDMLWQKIIEYLSYFERTGKTTKRLGLLAYENYPQTLAEAQKYFINI